MPTETCSCEESQHYRKALRAILRIATNDTGYTTVDDMAQLSNLAGQALTGEPLEGDPGVYDVSRYLADDFINDDGDPS